MEIYINGIDPEELGEDYDREHTRVGGGGSRPKKVFGSEHRDEKIRKRMAREAQGSNKETIKAKNVVKEQVKRLLDKEKGSVVHKMVRNYFEWVKYASEALVNPKDLSEIMLENDLEIKFVKSSGAGGQNVNRRDTAASIKHLPTLFTLKNKEKRSQFENEQAGRAIMFNRLKLHLESWNKVIGEKDKNEMFSEIFQEALEGRDYGTKELECLGEIKMKLRGGIDL